MGFPVIISTMQLLQYMHTVDGQEVQHGDCSANTGEGFSTQ